VVDEAPERAHNDRGEIADVAAATTATAASAASAAATAAAATAPTATAIAPTATAASPSTAVTTHRANLTVTAVDVLCPKTHGAQARCSCQLKRVIRPTKQQRLCIFSLHSTFQRVRTAVLIATAFSYRCTRIVVCNTCASLVVVTVVV
jgi:hypothetical protein